MFETTLSDARPLKKAPRRPKKQAKPKPVEVPSVPIRKEIQPATTVPVLRRTVGVDGNTADRSCVVDLDRAASASRFAWPSTERDAHRALITFVRGACSRKLRLILIVTGKGGPTRSRVDEFPFDLGFDMSMRGVLRKMTPRWLREPGRYTELIVDGREAHRRHGENRARFYVYLRKQTPT